MNSSDFNQIKVKIYLKMGDAGWHHYYELYIVLSIELPLAVFNTNSLFVKDFLICNTRCDVCGLFTKIE